MFVNIAQVTNALERLPEDGSEELRQEYESTIAFCQAAMHLQLDKLPRVDLKEAAKHAQLLMLGGYSLPTQHQQLLSRRVAQQALEDNNLDHWVHTLSLVPQEGVWSFEAPNFCYCDVLGGTPNPDGPGETHQWRKAVVGGMVLRLVARIGEEAGSSGDRAPAQSALDADLTKICQTFLEAFDSWKPHLDQEMCHFAMPVVHVMRGLLALCSPVPQLDTCSMDDVNYIYPKNKTTNAFQQDFPKLGRIIATRLHKDAGWCTRLDAYLQHTGAEHLHGPPLLSNLQAARDLSNKSVAPEDMLEHHAAIVDLFTVTTPSLKTWHAELRPGATKELTLLMVSLGQVLMRESQTLCHLKVLQELLCTIGQLGDGLPDTAGFLQEVSDEVFSLSAKDTLAVVKGLAEEVASSPSLTKVMELAEAVTGKPEAERTLQKELQSSMLSVLNWLEQAACKEVNCKGLLVVLNFATDPDHRQWHTVAQVTLQAAAQGAVCHDLEHEAGEAKATVLHTFAGCILTAQDMLHKARCTDQVLHRSLQAFVKRATEHIEELKTKLEAEANTLMTAMVASLKSNSDRLRAIAGGAANGTVWHSCQASGEPILDVYARTLGVADKGIIQEVSVTLHKAGTVAPLHTHTPHSALPRGINCDPGAFALWDLSEPNLTTGKELTEVQAESKAYMYVLPEFQAFEHCDGPEVVKAARTVFHRACTTKAEALLCQALLRPNSKRLRERVLTFTAVRRSDCWGPVPKCGRAGMHRLP